MKIFISWSGERSQVIAEALREWLVRVIQRLEPWVSSEDIRAGARWQSEISGRLATTKVGILCLTSENITSPWLHFEAGALAKTVDNATFVCPYLINLEPADVALPIGQFQSQRADHDGTRHLIRTINRALGDDALVEAQLDDAFETYWPRLKEVLDKLPALNYDAPRRDTTNVLEEILEIVRGLARAIGSYDNDDVEPSPEQQEAVTDLMDQLRKSLDEEARRHRATRKGASPSTPPPKPSQRNR